MEGKIVLAGLSPSIEGLQWETNTSLRIGRSLQCDICLHDPTVSREHAEVYLTPQGWQVRNLGGGVLVNGVTIGNTPRSLQREDRLQLGRIELRVAEAEVVRGPVPRHTTPTSIKTTGSLLQLEAFRGRSWEEALRDWKTHQAREHLAEHFMTLLSGGLNLGRITSLGQYAQPVLDDLASLFETRRAALALVEDSGTLRALAVSGPPLPSSVEKFFSVSLAERCLAKGESLLCSDAPSPTQAAGAAAAAEHGRGTILCALVRSPRKRLGVLYLERGAEHTGFTADDLAVVDAIAARLAVEIETAQRIEQTFRNMNRMCQGLARLCLSRLPPERARRGWRLAFVAQELAQSLRLSMDEVSQAFLVACLRELVGSATTDGADVYWPAELAALSALLAHEAERWDGTGPGRRCGTDIPILARILRASAAWVAVCEAHALPEVRAANLRREEGTALDPECVEALLGNLERIEQAWHEAARA